ncbi:importin-7, putative [Plasmodium gallinaceum]|uniref:Importin-7, putative n=1 Tax=Plasmodium gallinaceum TaxID=5849 RepID=A0A1J1GZJ6_PLAGA|nr:importin-7, putative [Plasmodium gallinaceum]CRG98030.1 importin-7, putative [Plasmodium gallinaceum]
MNELLSTQKLCEVLEGSISDSKEKRSQCEEYLKQITKLDGYINVILNIVKSNNVVDDNIRISASIFLKNSIKNNYDRLKKEEISALTKSIYESLLYLEMKDKQLYIQLFEIMKILIHNNFPEYFYILDNILEDINQRKDVRKLYVSLYCLKLIFKKLKIKKKENNELYTEILNKYFYPLINCLYDLSSLDINNNDVSEILSIICKIYYYVNDSYLIKEVIILEYMDNYFSLFDFILKNEIVVPNYIEDQNYLKKLPQFKCKRIVLDIITRLFSRYVNTNYNKFNNDITKKFCEIFLNKWLCPLFEDFIIILQSYHKNKKTLTDECLVFVLQGLSYGVENSLIYKNYIKNNVDFLVRNIIFPILCYNQDDIEKVIYDEYDYTINIFNTYVVEDKKASASSFIKDLTRYRGLKHISDLFLLCENIISTYNENYNMIYNNNNIYNSNNNEKENQNDMETLLGNDFCKYKYGALKILECLYNRLCDKKRNMNIEEFLKTYVENDLNSPNYLLCYQSIVTYCCFIKKVQHFSDLNNLLRNYEIILNHMSSSSLLIRVASASYIKKFFKIKNDFLKNAIIKTIPILIERLLNVIKEIKCEYIVMTLDNLAYTFKDYITPYVNDVIIALCSSFVYLINKKDVEENGNNSLEHNLRNNGDNMNENSIIKQKYGMNEKKGKKTENEELDLNSVILSILTAILSLLDSVDEGNKEEIYKNTVSYLYVVVDETFKSPSIDYLEEALSLLTNITYYLDIDEQVYLRFEKLYDIFYFNSDEDLKMQEINLIRSNPQLILSTDLIMNEKNNDAYFYDFIFDFSFSIGVFDNIISKATEYFVNMYSQTYSMKYIHMVYRLGIFALHSKIIKGSCKLFFILFEATVKIRGVDELIIPVLTAFSLKIFKHDEVTTIMDKKKKDSIGNNDETESICSEYDEDILSKTSIEYIKNLFYAIIIYDVDKFFLFFNNMNKTNYILLFLSNLSDVKINNTRKLYLLAMSTILENIHNSNISMHINEVNSFILNLVNVANSYYENKNTKEASEKSYDTDTSSVDDNSEVDIDENEDATNEKAFKLIKTIEALEKKNDLKIKLKDNVDLENLDNVVQKDNNYNNEVENNFNEEDDDDDDDAYYDYDDCSDYSTDEYRKGFFDDINAFKILYDATSNFYSKYENTYNNEVLNKIKYLFEADLNAQQEEQKNT